MLFTIQNFTQGDLHSTGGIQISIQGVYNSTRGIQISFLGFIIPLEGFRYLSRGFIIPPEGFRYLSRGFIIPPEGFRYSRYVNKSSWLKVQWVITEDPIFTHFNCRFFAILYPLSYHFQNVAFQYFTRYEEFRSDHILEMPGQGEFRDNCFKNHTC